MAMSESQIPVSSRGVVEVVEDLIEGLKFRVQKKLFCLKWPSIFQIIIPAHLLCDQSLCFSHPSSLLSGPIRQHGLGLGVRQSMPPYPAGQ